MSKARKFLATIRTPSTGGNVFVVAVNWGDNVIPFDENIELISLEYYEKLEQENKMMREWIKRVIDISPDLQVKEEARDILHELTKDEK
jgi:hypothetical protein